MGKFRTCAVTLKQGQEVFRDGERVSGVVMLEVTEPVVVKGVRVFCYGEALTKWSKEFTRDWDTDQVSTENYFAQVFTVFGKKQNEEGPNSTLTAGKHRWAFTFRLPDGRLPSSFEGQYGAIRWFLKVEVDKPFPSINNKWYKPFTVLSHLDLNDPVFQPAVKKEVSKTVSKALGLGNAGTLTLFAQLNHFGYSPGETILLKVDAQNNSSKDMGKIIVALAQKVVFTANDETKSTSQVVASIQTEKSLTKETTITMTDLQLVVPAVPPSTRKRTCYIISCTYTVRVSVQVPWGLNLDAVIPVAIGTVPRGHKVPSARPSQPRGAAAAAGPAAAQSIRHVRCVRGIVHCSKSHNSFPNLDYTPLTALFSIPSTPVTSSPKTAPTKASPQQQTTSASARATSAQPAVMTEGKGKLSAAAPVPAETSSMGPPPPGLTTNTPLSAVLPEMDLPPAYEDIVGMEEDREEATVAQMAVTKAEAEGRKCVIMLVRFPDSSLASFRQTIRREQNNLMDTDLAFLAALSPQPMSTLTKAQDFWPDHYALALLVFPDSDSGQEWVRGVKERGDTWIADSDILMVPGSWSVPQDVNGRLVLGISVTKTREGADKERILAFQKSNVPLLTKLRMDHGGIRQSLAKKPTMLHGQWVSCEHNVGIIFWPRVRNYMAYCQDLEKETYAQCGKESHALYDTHSTLLLSEDVTSLSTESATSPDEDDLTRSDEDDNNKDNEEEEEEEKEGADEVNGRVENLLGREERQTAADNSD